MTSWRSSMSCHCRFAQVHAASTTGVWGKVPWELAECSAHLQLHVNVRPCALQHLASLSLDHGPEPMRAAHDPPQVALQLPASVSRLSWLHFGSYCDWDTLHEALWPLAVLAAVQSVPKPADDSGGAFVEAVPPLTPGSASGNRHIGVLHQSCLEADSVS